MEMGLGRERPMKAMNAFKLGGALKERILKVQANIELRQVGFKSRKLLFRLFRGVAEALGPGGHSGPAIECSSPGALCRSRQGRKCRRFCCWWSKMPMPCSGAKESRTTVACLKFRLRRQLSGNFYTYHLNKLLDLGEDFIGAAADAVKESKSRRAKDAAGEESDLETERDAKSLRLRGKMNKVEVPVGQEQKIYSPNRNCWGSQFILQRVDGQDDLGT